MKNPNTKSYQVYLLLRQKKADLTELQALLGEEDIPKILTTICASLKEVLVEQDDVFLDNVIKTFEGFIDKIEEYNLGCCLNYLKKLRNKVKNNPKLEETIDEISDMLLQKLNTKYEDNHYDFLMSIIEDIRNMSFLKQILNTYPYYINARNKDNKPVALVLIDKVLDLLDNEEIPRDVICYHGILLDLFKRNRLHISNTENNLYADKILRKIESLKKGPNYKKKLNYYLTYVNCLLHKKVTEENISSIMERHNIVQGFDIIVQREVANLFKQDYIITIDDIDTLDKDDALSIERFDDHYHLKAYNADVSQTVPLNSAIDKAAYEKQETIYLSDNTIWMLPVELSNVVLSLNDRDYKKVWKHEVDIYDNGELANYTVNLDRVKITKNFTYDQANYILDNKKSGQEYETLEHLSQLSLMLRSNSDKTLHRTIEDYVNHKHWVDMKKSAYKNRTKAEIIVEECMILINFLISDYCTKHGYPMIYRVHEQPGSTSEYNSLMRLKDIIESEYTTKANYVKIIESLMATYPQAYYSTSNLGHFGLCLSSYCHGTAPVRRYPDIAVQRILSDYVLGNGGDDKFWYKYLNELCAYANETMRKHQAFQEEYEITKSFLKK